MSTKAKRVRLFPKQVFIVLNFVALKKFEELLLEGALAMMVALFADVINHRFVLGAAD